MAAAPAPTAISSVAAMKRSELWCSRHESEQGAQGIAADDHDDGNRNTGLGQGRENADQHRSIGLAAENGDEQEQRDDGQVLEQQDGEARAARLRTEALGI